MENEIVTLNTLSNAAELAAGIITNVLNDCFCGSETPTPTLDEVREAALARIQNNHGVQ